VSITKVLVLFTRSPTKLGLLFSEFSTIFYGIYKFQPKVKHYLRNQFSPRTLEVSADSQPYPYFAQNTPKIFQTLQCSPRAPAGGSPAKFRRTGGRDRPGAGGERPSGPWGSIPVLGLGRGVAGELARRSPAAVAAGPRAPVKRRPMRAGLRPGHRR
jgi:hypothetical protein